MQDFLLNGEGHGDVANILLQHGGDVSALRPYMGADGRSYITVNRNGKPEVLVTNSPATLRKDEWLLLDTAVIKAAKERLRAFADLRAAGLTYSVPNAMGKTVLESQNQSDINPATMSMDGLRKGDADRPEYDLVGLPLPIIHKDFHFSLRQLMTSRNGTTPLDTTMAELAGRKVAEMIEMLTVGTAGTFAYGGYNLYGYTNFPHRLTKSLTLPTANGWTPHTLLTEVLEMKQQSMDAYHYGPWRLYFSPAWDEYLDDDYSAAKGDNTLRERLLKINGITAADTLDHLTGHQVLLVQQSSDVVRAVVGMDVTTLQWPSHGGLMLNYKVMAIMVPQFRTDHNLKTGIVHGTAA